MISKAIIFTLFLAAAVLLNDKDTAVHAFPGGAGACIQGSTSVLGHVINGVPTASMGALSNGNLVLTINGVAVEDGGEIDLLLGEEYEIGVKGVCEQTFRGFLLRGEEDMNGPAGGGGTLVLDPKDGDAFVQPSGRCVFPAVGITHLNEMEREDRIDVEEVSGTIEYMGDDEVIGVTLDVSVVVAYPVHYYSGYTINFVKATGKKGRSFGGKKGGAMFTEAERVSCGGKKDGARTLL
ncbi:MAG: hypothetical protein SGARI_000491 [Bacillariaceae sp.]